ncbi:MAG TPA: hypothetical protein PLW65_29965 [Pseudomonadota bacterium]|nr:hypothetical protein [Pseudomonadota bacterium]
MTDRELLVEHLVSALADAEAGRDDYFEVAALAGLLERYVATAGAASLAEQEVLAKAHALRVDGTLRARLPEPAAAADITEQLLESPGEYDEQDRRDMLLDLDELCAGAWFAGEAERFAAATQELAAAVYADPDSWREQSSWVAVVLASAPPLPGDLMLPIFRAILKDGDAVISAPQGRGVGGDSAAGPRSASR